MPCLYPCGLTNTLNPFPFHKTFAKPIFQCFKSYIVYIHVYKLAVFFLLPLLVHCYISFYCCQLLISGIAWNWLQNVNRVACVLVCMNVHPHTPALYKLNRDPLVKTLFHRATTICNDQKSSFGRCFVPNYSNYYINSLRLFKMCIGAELIQHQPEFWLYIIKGIQFLRLHFWPCG